MPSSSPTSEAASSSPVPQETNQEDMSFGKLLKSVLRGLIIAFLINQVVKIFLPQNSVTINQNSTQSSPATYSAASSSDYANAWGLEEKLDLHVYVSEDQGFDSHDPSNLVFQKYFFRYGDWNVHFKKELMLSVPISVQHNGSFYCHVYLTKHSVSPNPKDDTYDSKQVVHRSLPLTHYRLEHEPKQQKHLLSSDSTTQQAALSQGSIRSYWNNNLTINVVADTSLLNPLQLPPFFEPYLDFIHTDRTYKPILYLNDFWSKQEAFIPISVNTTSLPLSLQFYPITNFKFQLYLSLGHSFQMHGIGSSDIDEIKRMFMETHPGLLALTFIVTLLHSLFEFLAFKNDVQFWKGKQNLHGISVRSMIVNLLIQCVIFLYLFDNQSETSYVILISNGIALGIEAWKVTKAVNIKVDWSQGLLPRLQWQEKESYAQTKEYDEEAFRYLQYFIYPCMLAYSIYSLLYHEHKGWYSFILSTAVGFVYAFSFLQLTPQLFINYKLKSVAHMNARTLTYKFLTTIIDDLYSFVIKMPTWHRIAVFRDDVVFLIYLAQRYLYRVDLTRPNEFGQLPEQQTDENDIPSDSKEKPSCLVSNTESKKEK